jgi:hypothetical protein
LKISGVIQLENLNAESVRQLHMFQRNHSDLMFNFSLAPDAASISLESFAGLALLTRLAAQVEVEDALLSRQGAGAQR